MMLALLASLLHASLFLLSVEGEKKPQVKEVMCHSARLPLPGSAADDFYESLTIGPSAAYAARTARIPCTLRTEHLGRLPDN
jgi:hypothetical protein